MPELYDTGHYHPTNPEIGRVLRDHNRLLNVYQSRFSTPETWPQLVDCQILLLKMHQELTRSQSITARAQQTIDYWERLKTDPDATWDCKWINGNNTYQL